MNKKKDETRILIVGPTEPLGGLEKCVALLAALDLGEGFRLHHLDTKYHPVVRRAKILKVIYIYASLLPRMRRIIKDESIDIVHIHTTSYKNVFKNIQIQEAAKKLGVKSIIHVHGGYFDRYYAELPPVWKKRLEWGLNRADALICLSDGWREFFASTFTRTKTYVLENAIDIEPFRPIAETRNYDPVDEMKALYIGRISLMKGVFELVDVAKKMRDSGTRIKFIILGRSERGESAKLRWSLRDSGLSDRFEIAGEVKGYRRDEYFRHADCFILPSKAEGMPITVLEAFAAGLPVVATRVGAIPEIIADGESGILVDAGDTDAITDALTRLANDHGLREKLGKAGLKAAQNRFDVSLWVEKLRKIYTGVIKDAG